MHVTENFVRAKGLKQSNAIRILKKAAEILQTKETGSVLLECMSNLVANEMYDPSGAGENAEESILAGIHKLQKVSDDLVVVTNEVFSDSMTDNPEMEEYSEASRKAKSSDGREGRSGDRSCVRNSG